MSPARPPIVRAEVREVALPLLRPFVTGFGTTATRRTVLIHLVDEAGHEGWGEAAALDHPYYLPDTTSGVWAVVGEWALPAALAAWAGAGDGDGDRDRDGAGSGDRTFAGDRGFAGDGAEAAGSAGLTAVAGALAPIRGNTFARCGVEAAFWTLHAAEQGVSLRELLGGPCTQAPVGESIGIHPTIDDTLAEVQQRLEEGYRRIKLKVKPGWDREVVAAVRSAVGDGVMVQVDANGSYTLDQADDLAALDRFGLACIEQPLGWDALLEHADLQGRIDTPICLDESLRSPDDVRRALRIGACRNVNLKPGRVGGLTASLEIHQICADAGVALWCGGMLESGIGRCVNLALCSLPGFTDPADMSPASVLYAWDLVDPTYEVEPDGTVAVPAGAGLGLPVREDRIAEQTVRRLELDPLGVPPA
ncbi:MAG TPA: o-succinylbenzoate synthase [Acidimicrobiales bacterium]|nr:o-succinylbenzoate synthase [Acidimicrobiales bacterium]